jgi:diguanylate cyclase (GGDEF)-like protein
MPAPSFISPPTTGDRRSAAPAVALPAPAAPPAPVTSLAVPGWRSLSARIALLFVGLLLLVQLLSFGVIRETIGRNARAAVADELNVGERLLQRLIAQNAERLVQGATVLASDYGFRAAASSADGETIDSALANHGERIGASVSALLDADFRLRRSAADTGALKPVIAQLAARAAGDERASAVMMLDGRPYQFVLAPMRAPVLIGWVLMGFALDRSLADDLRTLSSLHLGLLARDAVGVAWRAEVSTHADTSSLVALPPEAQYLRLADGEYGVRRVRLWHSADGAEVTALLLRSVDEAVAPYLQLQWFLAGLTAVGLLVFAVGSALAARHVTTPITQLVGAAERLGNGDYDTPPSGLTRLDEIGGLAKAFDQMRVSVAHHQREVLRLAYWDALTGLPNRVQFARLVERAIDHAEATRGSLAVIMLDLDRFKHVNDVLGFGVGDALLRGVADRLRDDCVRDGDTVARLSGDEFALLLPRADAALAMTVARRIERSFERPISLESGLDEQTVDLGAGIGVACWPQHAADADALLGRAEIAMYAAKRLGNGALLYDPSVDSSSTQTLSLLSELRRALEHGELRLYLQPKVSLERDDVVGAEALVRWQHPTRGLVPPLQFIPFAEQTGFIRQLTLWVFERAAETWQRLYRGGVRLRLSINLSTRDLLDPELPEKLDALLMRHRAPAEAFCLEITESAIMDDPVRAQATLERLSTRGFKLAIDDFGTGYSSLAYLKRLPVDELKIDKSFVLAMEREPDDAKIVRSTIDLAHNLGLSVVAEGVENAATMHHLRELSCDEAQGYHLSKPLPADDFIVWHAAWAAQQARRRVEDAPAWALTIH